MYMLYMMLSKQQLRVLLHWMVLCSALADFQAVQAVATNKVCTAVITFQSFCSSSSYKWFCRGSEVSQHDKCVDAIERYATERSSTWLS
jgi:hypothetical protein